jgi:tetratricopeptide (TPR) repeat protein
VSAATARRYYVRGNTEMGRGEYEAAAESFRAAMDMYAGFLSARLSYAVALARQGDAPRAAQVLRAGIAREERPKQRATLFLGLGDALVQGGDFFGAEDAYKQAKELVPGLSAADAGLARVHARLGRYGDSFAALLSAARATAPAAK